MSNKNLTQWMDTFVGWGEVRELYNNSDYTTQFLKYYSELGEMTDNMAKGRCIKDDIGDQLVVITHLIKFSEDMVVRGDVVTQQVFNDAAGVIMLTDAVNDGKLYDAISILKGIADHNELNILECCEVAWNDIKDRKGKFINGTFVKESDL